MSKPDGGAAFPGFAYTSGRGPTRLGANGEWETFEPGMTVRDYFAAAALKGFCSTLPHELRVQISDGVLGVAKLAAASYVVADAMIAERDR